MKLVLWTLVLLASVWAAHWGADKLAAPLEKLRRQWGLSEAAGAAFVALATASPEVGTNTASAVRGLSDIGLGNLLGSNIISVPVIVTVAFIANKTAPKSKTNSESSSSENRSSKDNYTKKNYSVDNASRNVLKVKPEALQVQAIPYLLIIALAAILTVPKPWQGLQPIDGWIMLAVYFIYLAQAIWRDRDSGNDVKWQKKEVIISIFGVALLAFSAYFIVTATENIVSILGISQLIGGLFITSTLSIAPEIFATWAVARSGQLTAATTSVIADNTATMTLALFPLALVSLPIKDMQLFSVNLAFVALLAGVYAAFLKWGKHKNSFEIWEVASLIGIYLIYLWVMLFNVLKVFG
ncbi:MAG: sodium:calcium exchanger [Cyanobacteria bacterium P01_A01_bin.84]